VMGTDCRGQEAMADEQGFEVALHFDMAPVLLGHASAERQRRGS